MNESGKAGSVRVRRVTPPKLSEAELHGKRLDQSGPSRRIRDADPVTSTGLDLVDLYHHHAAGARRSNVGNCKAIHVLVKFPAALVDGSDPDWMLQKARQFAERIFGDRSIFADRVDRDEKSLNNVDLFLAPRYVKSTRAGETDWISTSRDLKALAKKHDRKPTLRGQGEALQDAWFEYLLEIGLDAERGEPKADTRRDWRTPEVIKAEAKVKEAEATVKNAEWLKESVQMAQELYMRDRKEFMAQKQTLLKDAEALNVAIQTAQKLHIREKAEFIAEKQKFAERAIEDEQKRVELKALQFGIECFMNGDITQALLDPNGRKSFIIKGSIAERQAIYEQIKPAVLKVWDFVRRKNERLKAMEVSAVNALVRLNKMISNLDAPTKKEYNKSITIDDKAAINAATEWNKRQYLSRD